MTRLGAESAAYYKALGLRIALARKLRGMTQDELARCIGVSQQAIYAYELGIRRVPAFQLNPLAKALSIPVSDLMGLTLPMRIPKRRLSPRAARHAERLQGLSSSNQRFVVRIIDLFTAAASGGGRAGTP